MSRLCPKCGALPSILQELQAGIIEFEVDENGQVSETGEIQDTDPNGVVVGMCSKCKNEWEIAGVSQACHYVNL